ncbi:MAG: M18 family aminopeptidase [Candidatus Cloacimonetes bacterium HGW-Cloacimonetes-3]|nr:MAG: M18 family aminopeptidase [Candidatus Cloacimonetes bacterium HGW-Cloacimonetes-3]
MNATIKDFLAFLDGSSSRFHASLEIQNRLQAAGFIALPETKPFKLKKGGKYYICRQDTAVLAFIMGSDAIAKSGVNLAASHIDCPSLKLKLNSVKRDKGVARCGVEVYSGIDVNGGGIMHTWTDRELSIAGKVLIRTMNGYRTEFVDFRKPLAIIPNIAIHLNREVNKGFQYNRQTHLQAILSVKESSGNPLLELLAKKLKVKAEQICDSELYLYDPTPAALIGIEGEMVSAQGLDNLAMTHAILTALIAAKQPKQTVMGVFYDHEEIGSQTPQGAMSSLLGEVLERLCLSQSASREDYYLALRNSFMISADMAHAYHPSYPEKYDPDYSPYMNKGIVIKLNANHRYASTTESSARFIALCDAAKVPYQKFLVRSDMPCGSTVGPIVSAQLGMETVDIGNPIWAMHSIRETGGTLDHLYLVKALEKYFG